MAKLLHFLISLMQLFDQSPVVEDYPSLNAYQPFDYFTLSLTWPRSYCNTIACKYRPIPSDFTIHGLWPNDFGKDLVNCYTDEKYVPITQGTLFNRLTKKWPFLKNGASENSVLWSLEWTKHGTCSLSLYNQKQYFTLAVDLKDRYDLLAAFKKNNITPGNKSYKMKEVRDTVTTLAGKLPSLVCKTASKKLLLVEVRICFDPKGVVIDCPVRSPTCGPNTNDVYLPK